MWPVEESQFCTPGEAKTPAQVSPLVSHNFTKEMSVQIISEVIDLVSLGIRV